MSTTTTETMDSTTAMRNVRTALQAVETIGPFDGKATTQGTMLMVRQWDGTAESWSYQHVAGGTMRCVRQQFDGLTVTATVITPLDTLQAVTDHLRSLMVEVMR